MNKINGPVEIDTLKLYDKNVYLVVAKQTSS